MITARNRFGYNLSVVTTGLTTNFNHRITTQQLYFSYQHRRPELPVVYDHCETFLRKYKILCTTHLYFAGNTAYAQNRQYQVL